MVAWRRLCVLVTLWNQSNKPGRVCASRMNLAAAASAPVPFRLPEVASGDLWLSISRVVDYTAHTTSDYSRHSTSLRLGCRHRVQCFLLSRLRTPHHVVIRHYFLISTCEYNLCLPSAVSSFDAEERQVHPTECEISSDTKDKVLHLPGSYPQSTVQDTRGRRNEDKAATSGCRALPDKLHTSSSLAKLVSLLPWFFATLLLRGSDRNLHVL